MSKKYKEYFDNISPDDKLVENTRKKMLEELNRPAKNYNIKPIVTAAACFLFTVSSIIIVPKLNSPQIAQTPSFTTETTTTTLLSESTTKIEEISQYQTSASIKKETQPIITFTDKEIITTVSETEKSVQILEQTQVYSETVITDEVVETNTPLQITEISLSAVPVTESEIVVTTVPVSETTSVNVRPGQSGGKITSVTDPIECCTITESRISYFTEIKEGDIILNINQGYDYVYNYPDEPLIISNERVEEFFGKNIIPYILSENFTDTKCIGYKYDVDFSSGIIYTFGTETAPDKKTGKFISMSVGEEIPECGYDISYINPVLTEIDGRNFVFGSLYGTNTFACSFENMGVNFKFFFKGYSISEILEIIMSV